jgi:phosphohistidine phosphatase
MLLYVVRHGIAVDRADPECPAEADRPLTDEGERRTEEAALGLRSLGAEPKSWFSSPYVRALQTAKIVARVSDVDPDGIRVTKALLPGAPPRGFLKEAFEAEAEEVICFGHAPHVDAMIAAALGCDRPMTRLKKAGAALLELHGRDDPRNSLLWLLPAQLLRRLGK